MKKILVLSIFVLSLPCIKTKGQSASEAIKTFVSGIAVLQNETINSITSLSEAATKKASRTIVITLENIKDALKDAQGKTCIIVVENHTIVKFSDTKNCNVSGSWGACMPYGQGFVKHGALTETKGFINNIIGMPDSKKRTLFIF
jgi:hypothetical protein